MTKALQQFADRQWLANVRATITARHNGYAFTYWPLLKCERGRIEWYDGGLIETI